MGLELGAEAVVWSGFEGIWAWAVCRVTPTFTDLGATIRATPMLNQPCPRFVDTGQCQLGLKSDRFSISAATPMQGAAKAL